MRIFVNILAFAVEVALIVGFAYIGAHAPEAFALLTIGVALTAAISLEYARFAHEIPFYFGEALSGIGRAAARVWTTSEALFKSAVAGFVALLTFSGTNPDRLYWTAILFAICVFVGTTLLLRLKLSWGMLAVRWGYFRLSLPLGILYSAGVYALTQAGKLPSAGFGDVAYDATFNLARNPSVADASEFLFKLTQATDGLIAALLGTVIPADYVPAVQIVASTNILPGFVLAVYTVAVVRVVLAMQWLAPAARHEPA
ncbi:MAG: hypothetical protein AAF732_05640 [Pseudomonadota bacterium]